MFLYNLAKAFLKTIFKVVLRLEVHGTENIPQDGAVVIASNHISLWDPPVIGCSATRKTHFMAKQELFVPVLGSLYKLLGAFPVKRGGADRAAIKHGIEILQAGKVLAIFPEGTRSKTGELGKAEPGALMMASKAKATIVPTCVDINRSCKFWPKMHVVFGKPIYFPKDEPITKDVLKEMTEDMMQSIAKLQAGIRNGN